jgi:hypothetical protein
VVALLLKDARKVVEAFRVSGCSGPSAFSDTTNARSKSDRAPARTPWASSSYPDEASRRMGMLGAERLLICRQRVIEERPCPCKFALLAKHPREVT